jgi:hypothetical protein
VPNYAIPSLHYSSTPPLRSGCPMVHKTVAVGMALT